MFTFFYQTSGDEGYAVLPLLLFLNGYFGLKERFVEKRRVKKNI